MLIQINLRDNNDVDFLLEIRKKRSSSELSPLPEDSQTETYARPQFSSIIERIERAYVTKPKQKRKKRKRKTSESDSVSGGEDSREYDLNDPFIDDSEVSVYEESSLTHPPSSSVKGGFYVTKGQDSPSPLFEEKNASGSEESPVVFEGSNISNSSSSNSGRELKRSNFVMKWRNTIKYVPSAGLSSAFQSLRETSRKVESEKSKSITSRT